MAYLFLVGSITAVKVALVLMTTTSLAACSEKAPAIKRLVREKPIDTCYLQEIFIPAYADTHTKSSLIQSADELEKNLAEFQTFMHDVALARSQLKNTRKVFGSLMSISATAG